MGAVSALATIGWPVIDRIHLFGDFAISPHGIFIAVGFLMGAWWLLREGPKRGVAVDHINTLLFWALIGAIVGSRLFYVIGHFREFDNIWQMLAIWNGGITLLGGIIGAIVINIPLMKRHGYRFFQVMDPTALGMSFGLIVGRIGDLIIGDHLGQPTNFILGFGYQGGSLAGFDCQVDACTTSLLDGAQTLVVSKGGAIVLGEGGQILAQGSGLHQTALYDMISSAVLFLLLYWMNRRSPAVRQGVMTCTFLLWYGVQRVLTDFLRVDQTIFGMTASQWTSLAAALVAAFLLIKWAIERRRRGPQDPRPTTFFVPPRVPGGV